MKAIKFRGIDDARSHIGEEVAVSEWLQIDQEMIGGFAEVTGDRQWIHVDVERARRESPFGAPIAHGYLTLSLLARFSQEVLAVEGIKLAVNYGLNRVRFPAPVKVDSRLRARFTLKEIEDIDGGAQLTWSATIDIEGGDKPACVAEMLSRWYFPG